MSIKLYMLNWIKNSGKNPKPPSGDYNVKVKPILNGSLTSNIVKVGEIDTSNATSLKSLFTNFTSLEEVSLLNTSNVEIMENMFQGCTSLTKIPLMDTHKVYDARNMFFACSSLTNIPLLDFSSVMFMNSMFFGCTNLTNESLNNILYMLSHASYYSETKTLNYIGLSQAQATTCTTLSNWADCQTAGWSTGY